MTRLQSRYLVQSITLVLNHVEAWNIWINYRNLKTLKTVSSNIYYLKSKRTYFANLQIMHTSNRPAIKISAGMWVSINPPINLLCKLITDHCNVEDTRPSSFCAVCASNRFNRNCFKFEFAITLIRRNFTPYRTRHFANDSPWPAFRLPCYPLIKCLR